MQSKKDIQGTLEIWQKNGLPSSPPSIPKSICNKKYKKVMDIGCGVGTSTFELLDIIDEEGKLYLVDYNKDLLDSVVKMVEEKSKKVEINTLLTDINYERINIEDNSIDIIYIKFVFHQLDNYNNVLLEIKRMLNGDGIAVIFLKDDDNNKEVKKTIEEITGFHIEEEQVLSFNFFEKCYYEYDFQIIEKSLCKGCLIFDNIRDYIKYFFSTYEYRCMAKNSDKNTILKYLKEMNNYFNNKLSFRVNKNTGYYIIKKKV